MLGLAFGTAALILVLTVFNGFEKMIAGMLSKFNPDIKITATTGKTWVVDTNHIAQIKQINGIETVSKTLEEIAFFQYNNTQAFGKLKGVDDNFVRLNRIDTSLESNRQWRLADDESDLLILGVGIRNQLGVYEREKVAPLSIYMPKRGEVGVIEQPFHKREAYPTAAFQIQQEFDNQYVIGSLDLARDILDASDEVSALEIKIKPDANINTVKKALKNIVGQGFNIKDRKEQDEAFFKLMNLEKWMSYAIASLTILLIAFNMIGALWMIVLEKRKDIAILKSMGTTDRNISRIFLFEGLLLSALGMLIGFVLALTAYAIHIAKDGGLVPLPPGYASDRYPVALKFSDFGVVTITVFCIGFLASLPAARKAASVSTTFKED